MRRVDWKTNSQQWTIGGIMFATQLKETLSTVNKSELARAIGCHRDTIAKWVSGKQVPSVQLLVRLCVYLYPEEWEKAFLHFGVLIESEK
jgi:transcriptional regulator with XRE-family HTH domain